MLTSLEIMDMGNTAPLSRFSIAHVDPASSMESVVRPPGSNSDVVRPFTHVLMRYYLLNMHQISRSCDGSCCRDRVGGKGV